MVKILLFAFLISLIISILLIFYSKNKKQATKVYSIHTFLGSSSTALEEPNEQKKSLIDLMNDYFKDSKDEMIDDEYDDIGDDGDGGE